jgi:hypothetical protein
MDFQEFTEKLTNLTSKEKLQFFHQNIHSLQEEEKVAFLLSILNGGTSPKIIRETAIKLLRQTSFQDYEPHHEFLLDRNQPSSRAYKGPLKNLKTQRQKNNYRYQPVFRGVNSVEEKRIKVKIIKFIARIKAPWVSPFLLDVLEYPCEEIRDFIINELGKRDDLELEVVYHKLLTSPWYVKSAVLKVLGNLKNPFSVEPIKAVIKESNVDVRRSAAQALGKIGGEESLPLLVGLVKDENHYVKISAEEALRKVSDLKFC